MRFEETYSLWTEGRITQEEAARILGVHERSFRRHVNRYIEDGLDGLIDKRLNQASARKAPVDEVMALADQYRDRHHGWNVSHFHDWYQKNGGTRSYTWVKNTLQEKRLVKKAPKRGKHRKRRPALDYAVKMRRFAQQDQLDRVLVAGLLSARQLDRFAIMIVNVHQAADVAGPEQPYGTPQAVIGPVLENFTQIKALLSVKEYRKVKGLEEWTRKCCDDQHEIL